MDTDTASTNDLEQRARRGDVEAQLALACRLEVQGDQRLARGWYARASERGSVPALRALAIHLLTHDPVVQGDGVNMMRSAAEKGDAEAAYVCGMLAAQDGQLEGRFDIARKCLEIAAERGWDLARKQLEFLGSDFPSAGALAGASAVRGASLVSRVGTIEGFASPTICDWLIERARPRLQRARVYDQVTGEGRTEDARSNSSIAFGIAQSDLVLMALRARIAATAGLPLSSLEAPAVLHYAPGEQFAPHFDFLDPAVPGYAKDIAEHGQRVATFLLYLNDDFEGGETDFPQSGYRCKGRKGDALLFWNVTPDGEPDMQTLHAGLPTKTGEKWLLSQWLREPKR
jgi:hypothetical protein